MSSVDAINFDESTRINKTVYPQISWVMFCSVLSQSLTHFKSSIFRREIVYNPFKSYFILHLLNLYILVINGEKAAFHSPVFAQKRIRTSEMLLNNILEKYGTENNVRFNRYFYIHAYSDFNFAFECFKTDS